MTQLTAPLTKPSVCRPIVLNDLKVSADQELVSIAVLNTKRALLLYNILVYNCGVY
jgi:hypothetical protein